MIMASAATPDMDGATNSKGMYQGLLAETARMWATCSNDGEAVHGDGKAYCRCVLDSSLHFILLVLPIERSLYVVSYCF